MADCYSQIDTTGNVEVECKTRRSRKRKKEEKGEGAEKR